MKKSQAKPMKGNYWQLLEIIKQQSDVLKRQVKFIDRLVKDNIEKENMINALMFEGGAEKNKS